MKQNKHLVILGGGEIATAIAIRLFRSGLSPLMIVPKAETSLRYHLAFGDAIVQGKKTVEQITAMMPSEEHLGAALDVPYEERLFKSVQFLLNDRKVPVLEVGEGRKILQLFNPRTMIDTITSEDLLFDVDLDIWCIGLYPYREPGRDCHVAIESRMNYFLGNVYFPGDEIPEIAHDPVFLGDPFYTCLSPAEGRWVMLKNPGDKVETNGIIGEIDEQPVSVNRPGQLWGIRHSGGWVDKNKPLAMVLEKQYRTFYRSLGFREYAVAGGVLEAVLKLDLQSQ